MMNSPLLLTNFMQHAARYYPTKEIVSVYATGTFRYTYDDWYKRTSQLAGALRSLGIKKGDRVASFSLNNHRHMELYFGVPCMGAVLHTLNIRLSVENLVYIINHAEDRILFIDEDVYFLIEPFKDQLKTIEKYVIMSQSGVMPQTSLSPVVLYDDLIKDFPETYDFPIDRDENEPCLICYTSATTGDPKGVVYSHRGLVLHSFATGVALGVQETDCSLHIVPMFHANAWGAPFACTMRGLKQVLPGRQILDMATLCRIIAEEKITFSCGVPTIWIMLHSYLESGGAHDFSSIRYLFSGGSAMPRHLIESYEKQYGVMMAQGYGATETSPVVTLSVPKSSMETMSIDEKIDIRATAGMPIPGLDVRLVNTETGKDVLMDGKEMGEILVRGPWIASEYYKDPKQTAITFPDGWFHTGDIGTMSKEGYISLVDRTKDLIKSAGEWISSIDLENAIMGFSKVLEAAVISLPDDKWQERPLACVVPQPDVVKTITKEEIQDYLKDKVAKWWIPDEIVFMQELPKTSVGKFNKKKLRETVIPDILKKRGKA
ncbi:MAG: fatty-acid--CoA ligase [Deltaproteobacteria bacterium HGW-Deltaproteobacteria-1]|jgi:fatty-acyl-CoA synthase|nr:MAG: fatty-acid--CoA ligase [Deltaproteobacteria bacterium HGW-Deltaproteobacteria-1]